MSGFLRVLRVNPGETIGSRVQVTLKEILMRAPTMHTFVLIVALATLAACDANTSHDPLAPMAATGSLLNSKVDETQTLRIRGTLEAHETDTYEPATNSLIIHLEG